MVQTPLRWIGACLWALCGHAARNRRRYYGDGHGLRVLAFHATPPRLTPKFRHLVEWCLSHCAMATPDDVDALHAGTYRPGNIDKVLLTFDDGLQSNFAAAEWLAHKGIRAVFFVIPSLVGRTCAEYIEYHRQRHVEPYPVGSDSDPHDGRGLDHGQVREMLAMGHRIGAHNFAHRDLGRLTDRNDLDYEIGQALDTVSEWTGSTCREFAVAFGQPENISPQAMDYLGERAVQTYVCFRGLNVPGRTIEYLLRHDARFDQPAIFHKVCIRGGGDQSVRDRYKALAARIGLLPG